MASKDDTNLWINFFKDAGIPPNIAVKYALTFAENRIKKDMLLDLNKEYLKEMGITLMGDIISILKHAKQVYEEDARTNVLKNQNSSPEVFAPVVRKTPASRILEHYIPREMTPPPAPVAPPVTKKVLQQRASAVAKRIITKSVTKAKPVVVREEIEEVEEVGPPKKKARRVLPEHEGKYKVIMPAGTTPRTQKILSERGISSLGGKKTVFERLGDSSVSSTTGVAAGHGEQRITITGISGLGSSLQRQNPSSSAAAAAAADKLNSVFSRLGNKPFGFESMGVAEEEEDQEVVDLRGNKLEYAGILKKSMPGKKKILKVTKKKTTTLKADLPRQTMMLQERLGMSSLPTPPTVAKVLPIRKNIVRIADNKQPSSATTLSLTSKSFGARPSSIKVRLGSSVSTTTATTKVVRVNRAAPTSAATTTSTSFTRTFEAGNVFTRLGR